MPKENKNTRQSEKPGPSAREDRRPQLMRDLGVSQWANVPAPVLEFLTSEIFPRPIRVLALLIRQSWGYSRPDAIRSIKRTKYGHDFAVPLLQRDIVEILGIDKEHVSRTVTQLERIGAVKVEGKKLLPVPNPVFQTPEKLPDLATFFGEDPIFQQLEKLNSAYRAELTAAVKAAVEPVRSKYLPRIHEVKTQFKQRVKASQKGTATAAEPTETAPPEPKVAKSGNFSESSPIGPTPKTTKSAAAGPSSPDSKVAKSGNFSELSPYTEVAKNGNFDRRIKYIGNKNGDTPKKTPGEDSQGTRHSRSVGQSAEPPATDRPTDFRALLSSIRETGICERLSDTPTPKLLREVAGALGDTPHTWLQNAIRAKWAKITSLGMLKHLATAAAAEYAADRCPMATTAPTPTDSGLSIQEAHGIIADPTSPADLRQLAREFLEMFEQPA